MSVVLVFLNGARVLGPFESDAEAEDWARNTPNKIFDTQEQWEHANMNCDFWTAELEAP